MTGELLSLVVIVAILMAVAVPGGLLVGWLEERAKRRAAERAYAAAARAALAAVKRLEEKIREGDRK